MVRKLAVIRKDDVDPCPFGLTIPFACENSGELVDRMAPLDTLGTESTPEEKLQIQKANMRLLVWQSPCKQCKYAGKLIPQKMGVECNFGDTAPGTRESGTLLGSPFYSKMFAGVGLDGLISYPLGYYADFDLSRNAYYGIYSLNQDDLKTKEFMKLADDIISKRKKTE